MGLALAKAGLVGIFMPLSDALSSSSCQLWKDDLFHALYPMDSAITQLDLLIQHSALLPGMCTGSNIFWPHRTNWQPHL